MADIPDSSLGDSVSGYNAAVGTSAEVVGVFSGTYAAPTAAQDITISSGSASDTSAGTGARTVRVSWVNSSSAEVTSDVTLNGQTEVALGSGFRVNSIRVLTAGSGLVNAGIVYAGYGTVTTGVPANVLCAAAASAGASSQALFSSGSGNTRAVRGIGVTVGVNATATAYATIRLRLREITTGLVRTLHTFTVANGTTHNEGFEYPKVIPASCDVYVDAINDAGSSTVSANIILGR